LLLTEIDFCGHATVASAHVLAAEYGLKPPFMFDTQIGRLEVDVSQGVYDLDAPITPAEETEVTQAMKDVFPVDIESALWGGKNLILVFRHEEDIRKVAPDMRAVTSLAEFGVGITSRGTNEYDCVSRYFAPAAGIDEDPVTGSAHAAMGPYWAKRLGQKKLIAYQASARGGVLHLNVSTDRITISGHAVTYMKAEIYLT